jgi:hypothetical protein
MWGWLTSQPFGVGSNLLQYATAVPTIVLAAVMWRKRRCKVWRCLRLGQHPVSGTTWKVCANHHLPEHHQAVRTKHAAKYPARLGHGESP